MICASTAPTAKRQKNPAAEELPEPVDGCGAPRTRLSTGKFIKPDEPGCDLLNIEQEKPETSQPWIPDGAPTLESSQRPGGTVSSRSPMRTYRPSDSL